MMKLQQLEYFVTVCNHGSLSSASKVLFVSQPALSSAISALEKEYDVKLFDRRQHTMILTEAGEFFYEKAKVILETVSIFERDLRDLSEQKKTIRIGVPPMIGSFLFPKIYNQYSIGHVDAKFEIWEEGSLSIRKKIRDKTLDLGFSILNDTEKDQYNQIVLLETELLYCVSKDNPLATRESLTIEDIKGEPIVLMREGFFQTRLIKQMFNQIGQEPDIVLVSSQITVLSNFVKMNLGGAFLIKELLDPTDDAIVGVSFADPLVLRIGLLWQTDVELHRSVKEFISYVTSVPL